jgi:hypothetical protein
VRDQKLLSSTITCRKLGGSSGNAKKRTRVNVFILINNDWFTCVNFIDGFKDILGFRPTRTCDLVVIVIFGF